MNLQAIRGAIIGLLLLASGALAFYVADLRWQDTLEGKIVSDVFATFPDGTTQYGPYCAKNGTRLEGGGICHVIPRTVAYSPSEALAETIGVGLTVMLVVGGGSYALANSIFRRLATRFKNRAHLREVAPATK